jgi:hypothetical protein
MITTQLRRYEVIEEEFDAWVSFFTSKLLPLRIKHNFTVVGAYADAENLQFVWIVSYPGTPDDLDAALERYKADPEWAAAYEGQPKRISAHTVSVVESLV